MNRPLFLPVLFVLLSWLASLPSPAQTAPAIPRHQISISFDLDLFEVNGTSRLVIPAGTPLHLDCGPLRLTGQLLEQQGQTPQILKVAKNNTLTVPPENVEQILTLSWQLQVAPSGENDNVIGTDGITLAGFWHPLADRDMLFSLEAVIPRNFEAISETDTLQTALTAGGKQVITSFAQPLRSLHFVAGPYEVQSKQLAEVTLSTYFFEEDASLAKEYLEKATGLIHRFQQFIGPFPYKRFAIVENRLSTGYGLPTFTLLGQSVVRLPFIKDRSLGHEILHSWFGNSVSVDDRDGNWSEGLATYLADQSFAAEAQQGPAFRKEQLIRYRSYIRSPNDMPLNAFQNAGDNRLLDQGTRAVGYDKSSMIFHMLRLHIGETSFQSGLRYFYQQMHGRRTSWQDLETAFTLSSGKNLHPFFQQWLERTDLPHIAIENAKIDQRQGQALLTFDLVQTNSTPYLLDIPLRITTIQGETVQTLHTADTRKSVSLELDSLPTGLILDGEYDLMRRLDPAELPPTWSQFLGAEQKNVIVPAEGLFPVYQPLLDTLRQAGCRLIFPKEASTSTLGQGSWLFLGDSAIRRSLFGEPAPKIQGFTLDVRRSPFNPEEVMVLVDSSSVKESEEAGDKLSHYGPFSRLHFNGGKNLKKTTSTSADGVRLPLIDEPQGIPMQATRNFKEIIDDLARVQVVYVGENHTEYGNHLLQLQILQALSVRTRPLVIGLEMFPRSSQQALDDHIQGKLDERGFLKASNYFEVWGYDYRLYRDILAYAKAQQISLIGLNLDKEITHKVFATGSLDDLTPAQQAQIAKERDMDLPGYQQRLQAVYNQHASPHGSNFTGFLQAQALWDETMAESVAMTLKRYPGHQMLVLAGNGHVAKDNGVPPRVERRLPEISQRVVTAAGNLESGKEQADYLMFAKAIELKPAGKMGVMLEEGKEEGPGRMRISGISPHGLAGKAGLMVDDHILTLDDSPVTSLADLRISLLDKKVGDTIQLQILRGQKQLTVPVELSTMETDAVLPSTHPKP